MGLRLFDFQCDRGHRDEHFVEPEVRTVVCRTCGGVAVRLLSAPRIRLEGLSGDFPTAAAQWEKRRESHMAKERKNKERHGTYK